MENGKKTFSILLLGTQIAVGGAQKVLLDQARWFDTNGHKVTVAFFYDRDGLYQAWKQAVNFPLHNLNAFRKGAGSIRQIGLLISGLWRLWKLLRRERFDAIETFTHDSNIPGLLLARLAGVPARIASYHGKFERLSRWREKLHAWLINNGIAQAVVAVSGRTRQVAIEEGIAEERIVVIPNGVTPFDIASVNQQETRKRLGLDPNDMFLLSVGRLVYPKGHEFLVKAMTNVTANFSNAQAGICGEGPLRPQLESQIMKSNLADHVRLLGEWADIAPVLAVADIFILPSRWEGLPMALLEAMAVGLPVIATRVEGVEETITDGVDGLLVPPEDSDELALAIVSLLEDPELRKKIGAAARARVLQHYTTEAMCRKYYELMLGLLNKR